MGKIILVTGGARSGKSSFAEEICIKEASDICYIATAIPFDGEMQLRIQKHQNSRPHTFKTYERYRDFNLIPEEITNTCKIAMLDCVTIMVTNLMMDYMSENTEFSDNTDEKHLINAQIDSKINAYEKLESQILNQIGQMLEVFQRRFEKTVIVTNEIGMGIVPDNQMSRFFRDIAGRANQMIAKASNEAYLCVSGIPVKIK